MRNQFNSTALAVLMAGLMSAPAMAADITIRDFIGRVIIEQGDTDLEVSNRDDRLEASRSGDEILINGGYSDPGDEKVCSYKRGFSIDWSINGRHSTDERIDDYPDIEITVPEGSTLRVDNSYVQLINQASLSSADLSLTGCLNVDLGEIDRAEISKSGSSNIVADRIGRLELQKSGSGKLKIDTLGSAEISVSGSGDMDFDTVESRLEITKSGSGDIKISEMNGPLSVRASGSGDIDVASGSIPQLDISKSGSGDAEIDADVVNANIKSRGSGDVYIQTVSGTLESSTSGSGDLDIGSRD